MSNATHTGLHRGDAADARAVLHTPFALTRSIRDPRSGMRRLRTGDGAWRFDLVLNRRQFADGDTTADNYSAAVVELGLRVDGRIGFTRRGFLRHPIRFDLPVVEAGSPALRDRFEIRASSPQLAETVVCAGLDDWLCRRGNAFHYELVHDRVLAYGWRRYLGGNGVLRAAEGFRDALSV